MEDIKIDAESIIKIDEIKEEVADQAGEDDSYLTEGGWPSFVKREAKDENEEEELKPLVKVFLDSKEVSSGKVEPQDEVKITGLAAPASLLDWKKLKLSVMETN
ncbi:Protein of unknown function [Gryllus bimaculatus]|nr:Protein of unknown function [Gryllus bimaculatus]